MRDGFPLLVQDGVRVFYFEEVEQLSERYEGKRSSVVALDWSSVSCFDPTLYLHDTVILALFVPESLQRRSFSMSICDTGSGTGRERLYTALNASSTSALQELQYTLQSSFVRW